ncbi:chemotaxis protein CheA [Alteromonas sp. C1M14]|uniref:chemotaxis protein CheA n=1 Tax=Alteromonas sp. C1M14 TaxID=2841567 RepID=UPI001C08B582|nr:chemotaxis protein CheA [Alteromonas sp. C1M14]MBU2979681.1 chemotaxis protein CheA [Alteromonas sp. C1M14]
MSIDIEQFHAVFFDESQEHLDDMERLLMALDVENPDLEELNSIFRAAHSIKGGSGIFGFDALMGLTHIMENLLDKARNQTISLDVPTVDLFLETVDLLKIILDAYRSDTPLPEQDIEAGSAALEKALANSDQHAGATPNQGSPSEESIEGFGFFDDDDDNNEEIDGFGFFDDDDDATVTGDTEIHAEQPTDNSQQTHDAALAAPSENQPKSEELQGFGFFDSPQPKPLSKEDKDGYGFYKPLKEVTEDARAAQKGVPKQPANVKSKPASGNKEASSIRVDTAKIDAMVNLVGELVITQSMLAMIGDEVTGAVGQKLQSAIAELQRNTREIQESAMSMRMLPVNMTFNRFPRVVRDLSTKLGKKVELLIEGGATEIDKSMIEKLADPLTHLVRNSIDHGIETTEARRAAGKNEKGTVTLRAAQKGSTILISIIDDGAGLSRERILSKAEENGLAVSPDMPDSEVWQLIFQAGFSTAAEVTDVSGRGVGMDVVRRNIEAIGGRIDIESHKGLGSAFHIHLPLTLAIVDGICAAVGDQTFVIPLVNIVESLQPTSEQIKLIGNDHLLWIRDQYWPLLAVHKTMHIDNAITHPSKGIVVLMESGKRRFAVQVDSLLGQQQVVIKSLEQHYRKVPGISGATIMGDGQVAMILDADAVADLCSPATTEEAAS